MSKLTSGWEALVNYSCSENKRAAETYRLLIDELSNKECLSWQEFGMLPHPEGWLLCISSCNEDGKVEILIPQDKTKPIQILMDTRKQSKSYESDG